MKKIPKTFYIKGHRWRVKYKSNLKHEDGSECYGICDAEKKVILLNEDCSRIEMLKAFWHEYGHALLDELHLVAPADGGMNETHEGVFCEGFADVMFNEWNMAPKRKRRTK